MRKLKLFELKRPEPEALKNLKRMPVHLVLDQVRSARNVGSIFRSADGFRIEKLHLCGITAVPPHPDIQKTALGATETVPWQHWPTIEACLESLKEDDISIIAVEQTDKSCSLRELKLISSGLALVFGHEVKGVSDEALKLCESSVEIEQHGAKHSLNVGVAAGIVMYHLSEQHDWI